MFKTQKRISGFGYPFLPIHIFPASFDISILLVVNSIEAFSFLLSPVWNTHDSANSKTHHALSRYILGH